MPSRQPARCRRYKTSPTPITSRSSALLLGWPAVALHLRSPFQESPQAVAFAPHKSPELEEADLLHLNAAVGFHSPAQVGTAPGRKAMAAAGPPNESQHGGHRKLGGEYSLSGASRIGPRTRSVIVVKRLLRVPRSSGWKSRSLVALPFGFAQGRLSPRLGRTTQDDKMEQNTRWRG